MKIRPKQDDATQGIQLQSGESGSKKLNNDLDRRSIALDPVNERSGTVLAAEG